MSEYEVLLYLGRMKWCKSAWFLPENVQYKKPSFWAIIGGSCFRWKAFFLLQQVRMSCIAWVSHPLHMKLGVTMFEKLYLTNSQGGIRWPKAHKVKLWVRYKFSSRYIYCTSQAKSVLTHIKTIKRRKRNHKKFVFS